MFGSSKRATNDGGVMKKFIVWAVALGVGVLGGVSTVVSGNDRGGNRFQVPLEGFQEVPTLSVGGRGRLTLRIDEDEETIHYRLRYSGLDEVAGQTVLQAHIHLGQRATNGGISAFLCVAPPTAPPAAPAQAPPLCTTPSGDIMGTITPNDVIGPAATGIAPGEWDELVRAIRSGFAYGNVHTTRFPGGEIRGQLGEGGDDGHGRDH
jgi:hypothetical protein